MEECLFCNPMNFPEQKIVFENDSCYFLQSPKAQNILEGAGLIIPKAHKETVFDLSEKEWMDTFDLMQQAKSLLDELHTPDGYSTGWNVKPVGGQSIPHAHFHIIPRFADEPYAGKGIRAWIKSEANRRPGKMSEAGVK
ncbi:HIT domain-containing protein [Bacillus sp. NEB1478]|uniref:HIT family protein n=1 Tax=Bacillus sp. NEB1478 TaxID=3073816 RepID=UPI002872BB8F|nr:HIT domain-containing protein [Bacillus sp. NEB1478]WNB91400.1 HIT domain-containing protein [Bacillus sp. NEB1478]